MESEERKAYRAEDRALLLGFYKWLFWDKLVEHLPASLKPNTITIVGESCAIASAVAAYFAARGTTWLYLVSAVCLFIYLTGDNCDGPHARRTKQTSVLGEFLDHGLDGLASCAVLLASSFGLHLGGSWLAVIAALAGLGFFATFWAQFRTYFLVTPQISAMEGVTGAALFQVMLFALGEPAWLHFSPDSVTPATVVVGTLVLAYLIAVVSPLLRAAKAGSSIAEVMPVALVVGAIACAALGNVDGYRPAIALSLVIAELVCRMIIHRHKDDLRGVLRPAHALLALPWLAVHVLPEQADVLAWAGLGAAAVVYLYTFASGVAYLKSKR